MVCLGLKPGAAGWKAQTNPLSYGGIPPLNTVCMAKLSTLPGFTKGVSVDVLYLLINDVLEYNLPYMQSDFTCNPGLTDYLTYHVHCGKQG